MLNGTVTVYVVVPGLKLGFREAPFIFMFDKLLLLLLGSSLFTFTVYVLTDPFAAFTVTVNELFP